MFEIGVDQSAGLCVAPRPAVRAGLMAVASPAQPAQAYELLCTLAAQLSALDRSVVVVDGTAQEPSTPPRGSAGPGGLLRALQDPWVSPLGRPPSGAAWPVLPGALGLQLLQATAGAGGAAVAVARLLAAFGPGTLVLLFAPAPALAQLLEGSAARVMVPVLDQPQATLDVYGAVKQLHAAGLVPALAPLAPPYAPPAPALQQTVATVADCARRHLGLALEAWPARSWGHRVQRAALPAEPAPAAPARHAAPRPAGALPFWS
jgi:hypothetical protein